MAGSPFETRHRRDQSNIAFMNEGKKNEAGEGVNFPLVQGGCHKGTGTGSKDVTITSYTSKDVTLAVDAT